MEWSAGMPRMILSQKTTALSTLHMINPPLNSNILHLQYGVSQELLLLFLMKF